MQKVYKHHFFVWIMAGCDRQPLEFPANTLDLADRIWPDLAGFGRFTPRTETLKPRTEVHKVCQNHRDFDYFDKISGFYWSKVTILPIL
jgi:hypothetical protein